MRDWLREMWLEWRHVTWPRSGDVAYNTSVVAGAACLLIVFVSVWEFFGRSMTAGLFDWFD